MTEPSPDAVTLDTLHEDLHRGFGDMRAGFADLKNEMRAGFTDLKTEMSTGFADLKAEMRTGFGDLKTTLVSGFRSLPTRETSDEMARLLREGNRLQEERFTQLDLRTREQHQETQQVLHALVEGQRRLVEGQEALVEGQRRLVEGQQALVEGQRDLSADI
ncbi:MAG: hypothetical protein L0Z49_14440, partial [Actinobacteria bacterium]|nr:hypothetical protein [Actinomycetota bacterium]